MRWGLPPYLRQAADETLPAAPVGFSVAVLSRMKGERPEVWPDGSSQSAGGTAKLPPSILTGILQAPERASLLVYNFLSLRPVPGNGRVVDVPWQ